MKPPMKNPFRSLVNWIESHFAPKPTMEITAPGPDNEPVAPVAAISPSIDPDISCFVRGVAASFKGEGWTYGSSSRGHTWWTLGHPLLDGDLYYYMDEPREGGSRYEGCRYLYSIQIAHKSLSRKEQVFLAQALEANPHCALKDRMDSDIAAKLKREQSERHFTQLGCPDGKS